MVQVFPRRLKFDTGFFQALITAEPNNLVAIVQRAFDVEASGHIVRNTTEQIQKEKELSHEAAVQWEKVLVILRRANIIYG